MNTFIISDTHFGHRGVCNFLRNDGSALRPWDHPDDMDRDMIEAWNKTVGPKDKVYHLGDVVINRKALKTLALLNGDKILIKGNHDIFKLADYTPYFRDIRAYHVLDKMIMSHIPVFSDGLERFGANIHGHLHANHMKTVDGELDKRYINVCVENIDFKPIAFDVIRDRVRKNSVES